MPIPLDNSLANIYPGKYVANEIGGLEQFIGQPMTERTLRRMEKVVSYNTMDRWIISGSTSATAGTLVRPNAIYWRRYNTAATTTGTLDYTGSTNHYIQEWRENTNSATTVSPSWTEVCPYTGTVRWIQEPAWFSSSMRANQFMPPIRVSPEERARREAEERRWREEEEIRKQERAAASEKAETLLLALLTPEQQEDYKNKRRFFLPINGELFRIDYGRTGNVKRVDPVTREVTDSYCIHPAMSCPNQDVMVAQKLMLETDIERFMKTANHHHVRPARATVEPGVEVVHLNA